jgi:hypothetical protein
LHVVDEAMRAITAWHTLAGKKKGATDFNELLVDASKTEREATGWQSGVSAMALDEDPHSAASPAAAAGVAAGLWPCSSSRTPC